MQAVRLSVFKPHYFPDAAGDELWIEPNGFAWGQDAPVTAAVAEAAVAAVAVGPSPFI